MIKLAKEWWQVLDACFLVITGYSILDASLTVASYSLAELFTIDKVGSVFVSIVAVCFWLLRAYQARQSHKKEQRIKDLEIQIKEMYLRRKDMEEEIKEFLKNDDESRNI